MRYRSADSSAYQSSSDDQNFYKVKRILAQRKRNDETGYLVHFRDEPAQKAIWTPMDQLNQHAQKSVLQKPPPSVD